jgi:hypothetical protein
MKKILLTITLAAISFISLSQEVTTKAFYKGYDKESSIYLFEDANENIIEFNQILPKVLTQFKLKTDELVDKAYSVTYIITEKEDEDGFVFEENQIIKLENTSLEYNANSGYEEVELEEN